MLNSEESRNVRAKVSVVISAYFPGSETLMAVLESVTKLDYPSELLDVVIVGVPEDDVTKSLVEEINIRCSKNFKLFLVDSRINSVRRNFGIKQCSTGIIAVIDDDILIDKHVISNSLKILSEHAEIGAVTFSVISDQRMLDERLYHMRCLGAGISSVNTVTACTVFRLSAIRRVGYYREDMGPPLSIYEDWELGSRMRKAGFRIAQDGSIFCKHLRFSAARHLSKSSTAKETSSDDEIAKVAMQYISSAGRNYKVFLSVMRSSPTVQKVEYSFYFLFFFIILGLFALGNIYPFIFLIVVAVSIILFNDIVRRRYRVFNMRRRLAYPLLVFLIRIIRTELVVAYFLKSKIKL